MFRPLIEQIADEAILNSKVEYDETFTDDRLRSASLYLGRVEHGWSNAYKRILSKRMQEYKKEADEISHEILTGARYAKREEEVIHEIEQERPSMTPSVIAIVALLISALLIIINSCLYSVFSIYAVILVLLCFCSEILVLSDLAVRTHFYKKAIRNKAEIARKASALVEEDTKRKDELYLFVNIIVKYLAYSSSPNIEEAGKDLSRYIRFPAS